jgi:F-type H+-transporting ATPase subunit gamma
MPASNKALRGRMRSVQNTRKITRTMELVSTSKLKRAQDRVVAARPYAAALADVISDLVTPELMEKFPLLQQPLPPSKGGPSRAAVILVTSNRGLAGGFNSNLIKEGRRRIAELEAQGYTVDLHGVGKKGIGFFKYLGRTLSSQRIDIGDKPTAEHAAELVSTLIDQYVQGKLASVDVIYAKFISPISTPPTTLSVLPVKTPEAKKTGVRPDYILEPSAEEILTQLLPLYVRNQVYRGLVETAAAEHGARRTAMKNATDNAGEIYGILKRTYNRQRQAAITQEIAEIVGGAAALEG